MEYFDLIMMLLEHNLMKMSINDDDDESDDESDDDDESDVFSDIDSDEEFTDFELQLLNNIEIDEDGEFRL